MNRFTFKNKKLRSICYISFIIFNILLFLFSVIKEDKSILFVSIGCLILYITYIIRTLYKRKNGGLNNE